MQATIGDDMRALLYAWQPDGVRKAQWREARGLGGAPSRCALFVKLGALLISVEGLLQFARAEADVALPGRQGGHDRGNVGAERPTPKYTRDA